MKNLLFLLSLIISLQSCKEKSNHTSDILGENTSTDYDQREYNKLYPMMDHFIAMNYPDDKLSYQALRKGLNELKKNKLSSTSRNGQWEQQGPGNIGGRINTIGLHPDDPQVMMLGYSLGGIFKTEDFGESWNPVFDDQINLSISDIKYDPNNPDIVYAGTGDHNISGFPVTGNGVFKSLDGGESWGQIGLQEAGVISEIGISKANSDVIYAAAMGLPFDRTNDRGLYKSNDQGSTWEQVLFLNDSTGVLDIEVHPEDENIVYATTWTRIRNNRESIIESEETGLYKTTNGGETWERLTNGLPSGLLVKPGLSMFEGDPDILYTSFVKWGVDTICTTGYNLEGIYKTVNAGENWTKVPTGEDVFLPCNALGGFGWYFGDIRVHPEEENTIYVLGVDMWKTTSGGELWFQDTPPWWTYSVHADKHDLVFNNGIPILATDGGAYMQLGTEWMDIEDIVATQFYRVALSPFLSDEYFGGAQDNGTTGGNQDNINGWPRIFGGDGFQMIYHPTDPNFWYVETQRGNIRVTFDGGINYNQATNGLEGSRNWDMQYIMSSSDPRMLYTGTDKMYRSFEDSIPLWVPISDVLIDTTEQFTASSPNISTLDESVVNNDILYCGTSDGLVWRSLDFGISWDRIDDGLPRRYISDIKASLSNENVVYVTIQGYKDNDFTPYIYKSEDNGDTWEHINGNLPQIALNDILLRPTDDDDSDIFVASDGGVFYTMNGGESWELIGNDMPIVPIYDLAIKDNILVAGSFARGIFTFDLAQLEETSIVNTNTKKLKIYPSVTSDMVTLSLTDWTGEIFMISSDGRIKVQIINNKQVDMSTMANGLYYIGNPQIGYDKVIKI